MPILEYNIGGETGEAAEAGEKSEDGKISPQSDQPDSNSNYPSLLRPPKHGMTQILL